MHRYAVSAIGLAMLSVALVAQTPPVTGDRSSPLRPLGGEGNVGISNAVLRDQPEVRVLRVVMEPGGTRVIHAHTGVQFHLFVPISGPMELNLDGGRSVQVRPWHPLLPPGRHPTRVPQQQLRGGGDHGDLYQVRGSPVRCPPSPRGACRPVSLRRMFPP